MEAFFEMGQFGAFVGEAGILVMHGGIVPNNTRRAAAEMLIPPDMMPDAINGGALADAAIKPVGDRFNVPKTFDLVRVLTGAAPILLNVEKLARIANTLLIGRQCRPGAPSQGILGIGGSGYG